MSNYLLLCVVKLNLIAAEIKLNDDHLFSINNITATHIS